MLNQSIKKVIPTTTPTLINYDYYDSNQGVGYQNFYGAKCASEAIGFRLTNLKYYSQDAVTIGSQMNTTTYTKQFSQAYSIQFKKPQQIGGSTIVNFPVWSFAGAGVTPYTFVEAKLYVQDGNTGVRTLLVDRTSSAIWLGYEQAYDFKMFAIPINIPNTSIKADDILFLDEAVFIKANVGAGNFVNNVIGHDPMNRITSGAWLDYWHDDAYTILTFPIPFRIDI